MKKLNSAQLAWQARARSEQRKTVSTFKHVVRNDRADYNYNVERQRPVEVFYRGKLITY